MQTSTSPDTDDITQAEQQVALRKADLARSLRDAGRTGEQLAKRIGSEMKPALIAATAVAGAVVLVGVGVALLRRRRSSSAWLAPQPPSALATFARGAGLWLARVAARRLAEEVTRRLAVPSASSEPSSIAASPNQI